MNIITGSYKQLKPTQKSFLGERWAKNGNVAGDLRCRLCGKWFSWSVFNKKQYAMSNRWDFQRDEPKHCGSQHCFDYEARYQKHLAKMQNDPSYHAEMSYKIWQRQKSEQEAAEEQAGMGLFRKLKHKGMVQ